MEPMEERIGAQEKVNSDLNMQLQSVLKDMDRLQKIGRIHRRIDTPVRENSLCGTWIKEICK